ncbi:YeaC family protein [Marinibactrum halimedae]|uniref:DUF1315 family protein n=1 Tax=Marinibactrum halimedae TaxID=1444977 RepID=A0AA37T9S8_9GAMM|nr:DUF1315 family protein [Marinibactrum halimedae]MCD9459495.1 YeaC family protein [Marinibactrum halimedae]GLS28149.1 hypothetical protein GCM10007877_38680 [Marinibactrum halimedae]
MNYQQLLESIDPTIYQNLKRAVELGKWPNGQVLSQAQRETCMQAIIAYEMKHLSPEARTGYVPPKSHTHCGGEGEVADHQEEQPLKWSDQ